LRILVVEDEFKMARAIRRGLEQEGYSVEVCADGDDAVIRGIENDHDAIVLDVMLPGRDGFSICRELRARGRWAPILMLTARDAVEDRIRGLDAGADDYLVKPFAFGELLARVRAMVRRGAPERPATAPEATSRSRRGRRTVRRTARCATTGPASRMRCVHGCSTASSEQTMRQPGAAPASAWPSAASS
jgi:DNA-binding response OmpR family regulator